MLMHGFVGGLGVIEHLVTSAACQILALSSASANRLRASATFSLATSAVTATKARASSAY
jgi:hypothetical protein